MWNVYTLSDIPILKSVYLVNFPEPVQYDIYVCTLVLSFDLSCENVTWHITLTKCLKPNFDKLMCYNFFKLSVYVPVVSVSTGMVLCH